MADAFTTRNRGRKPESGQHSNAWAALANEDLISDRMDEAMDGVQAITLNANKTLTPTNGETDEARMRVLNVTGTGGYTITAPAVEKWYLVRAGATNDVTMSNGSNSTTIKAGNILPVFTDGTNIYQARCLDYGSDLLKSSGTPTVGAHLTNKTYVDAQVATVVTSAGAAAAASASAAATSATNAATSATNASNSATAAAASATAADSSADDAADSAAAALTSETNAAASAASINPALFVHLAGAETISGVKTFSNGLIINGRTLDGLSAIGLTIAEAANEGAVRTALSLVPGTDVQAYDADLAAIAALTSAANKLPYATGAGTWALTDLSAFIRTLLDDADAAAAIATLGAQAALVSGTNIKTINGSSVLGSGDLVVGTGWTQIGSPVATTSGTSWAFTSIPDTYSDLLFVIAGFSTNGAGNFQVEASDNNGSGYSTALAFSGAAMAAASAYDGYLFIPGYNFPSGGMVGAIAVAASNRVVAATENLNAGYRMDSGIDAVRFSNTLASTGDAGSITLYGRG